MEILVPYNNSRKLCQLYLTGRKEAGNDETKRWDNYSYPPAAMAYFQSQKPCTNLEEFLLFLCLQQENPASHQAVSLNFPPNSDMAKILSLTHRMYFSQNENLE